MSGMRWTEEQLAAHQRRQPLTAGSKFGNKRTEVNGRKFDSKLEASRWQELEQQQALGVIEDLRGQVPFPLMVNGEMVGSYVADAVYRVKQTQQRIVEDSKGRETDLFRWKAKHFRIQYGFDITLIRKTKVSA